MAIRLEVDGAGRLVDALGKFNKEIYKDLQKEIRAAAEVVAADARNRTPASVLGKWGTWDGDNRDWDESRVDRSIKVSVRKTRVRGVRGSTGIAGRVGSNNAALAIFGTAGSKTPNAPFNVQVRDKWGAIPQINGRNSTRVLGEALIEKGPEAAERIDQALERAQAKFGLR